MINKVVLIVLILVLTGCEAKPEDTTREVILVDVPPEAVDIPAIFEALDEMSIIPDNDDSTSTDEPYSYDVLSEDELRIRFVVEGLRISHRGWGCILKREIARKKIWNK